MVSFGDSLSDIGSYNVGSIAGLGAGHGRRRPLHRERHDGRTNLDRTHCSVVACGHNLRRATTGLQPSPQTGLTGAAFTAKSGCFNYAQGGSRVTSPIRREFLPVPGPSVQSDQPRCHDQAA
jgi:outer membrane lipase/esterase